MDNVCGVDFREYSRSPSSELDALEHQQKLIDRGALVATGLIVISSLVKVAGMVFT